MEKSETMLIKAAMTYCANVIGILPYLLINFSNFIKTILFPWFLSIILIFFFEFRIFLLYFIFYTFSFFGTRLSSYFSFYFFLLSIEFLILFLASVQLTLMN